jgi:Tol biopolymer transport system component
MSRPIRLALTSLLAALAVTGIPATAAATFVPGARGKIVFTSGRASSGIPTPAANDADARLWVADYPSGTPVQVTTLPAGTQHRHPNWSPDHTKIVYAAGVAFSGTYALWIKDMVTGDQTEFVPAAPMQDRPSWSPDGTKIAYGSGGSIYVKGVAPGSTPVPVTNGTNDERPVWSPDGNTIYFNRGAAGNRDIYRKSPVTLAGQELDIISGATDDWQPAVSPDGGRLCFLRGPQSDLADLYVATTDGIGATGFSTTANVGDLNCVWSPDGTRIMYTLGAFTGGELATRNNNGGDFEALSNMNVAQHFDGNADWATNLSPTCDARNASMGVNGFASITLSCDDPDSGFGADPPTSVPLEAQAIEIVEQPRHGNIGSISDQRRIIYTPDKDFRGTDTFTYRGNDGASDSAPATVTVQVGQAGGSDRTAPVISRLTVSPRRWRRGNKLPAASRTRVGTTISFRLSERALATLSFRRALPGRRAGGRCVKPTRRNRSSRPCTRFVRAGNLPGFLGKDGLNRVRFQGRLTRKRRLAPGSYRVLVGARDNAGNAARARASRTFRIVAR